MKNDNFLKTFILLVCTVIFLLVALTTFWSSFLSNTKQETESIVLMKQSEKSLFFRPLYSVITTDNEYGNYVTKKTFDVLEFGDTISGFTTKDYSFFTTFDYVYTSFFIIPLIFGLSFLTIVLSISLLSRISLIENLLQKFFGKWKSISLFKFSFLTLYFLFALVYVFFFSLNIFHKVVPINQTKVEASIVDRDFYEKYTQHGDLSYYHLIVDFNDENGESYRVVKGVSEKTFSKYAHKDNITISYRNKNPYDIFIASWSIGEIFSAAKSVKTVLYFIFIVSIILIYSFYIHELIFDRPKKRQKKKVKKKSHKRR